MGAGHNGLTAAAYLAKAGKKVIVLEAADEIGGATASVRAFKDYDAMLSRYSYLVSLLPDQIVKDLGLNFTTLSRTVSSYTPYVKDGKNGGLLVSRKWDAETERSFAELTGSDAEGKAWQEFYGAIEKFAQKIAPSLLQPLPTRSELKSAIAMDEVWDFMIEKPIGEAITDFFKDDIVRGVVLTDALVGTFSSAYDLQANICFLYHLMGNGTGEWKVPQGGMGALVRELERVCAESGVTIVCKSEVKAILTGGDGVEVTTHDGTKYTGEYLLSNAAPQILNKILGVKDAPTLNGAQMKINLLLERLPQLKSGEDPRLAFAGTFHVNESFRELEESYIQAKSGSLPSASPSEMYCHTLTDPSILSEELQRKGYQTLTLFGFHADATLFDKDPEGVKAQALAGALAALNEHLAEPIESVVAKASDGSLCIEAKSPHDLEKDVRLPRGNIFHRDLNFPFREDGTNPSWGVETDDPRIFICGAGAIRGGGVSGIPGHNAAMAVLTALAQ